MAGKKTKKSTVVKRVNKTVKAKKKGGMSKMAAPIGGAVIGATLGTAAGAVLTNDKAKKTLLGVAETLGEYTSDALNSIEANQDSIKKHTDNAVRKARKELKKN